MPEFVKVAKVEDLAPGDLKAVELDGEHIVLANVDGQIYAFGAMCTHRGGPLWEGLLEGEVVTCPWHGGRFNIKTGQVVGPPPREPISTYRVRVEEGEIKVSRS